MKLELARVDGSKVDGGHLEILQEGGQDDLLDFARGDRRSELGDPVPLDTAELLAGSGCRIQGQRPVVIIGAGHGGTHAAARLVDGGAAGHVILIDGEVMLPYERPPLSKEFLKEGGGDKVALLRRELYYQEKGIDLRLGTRAASIDRAARRIAFDDGSGIEYSQLILATGSRARTIPIPGADLPGVLSLKTLDDARSIAAALRPGIRVVIIGAGYIGMEVAAAAAEKGVDAVVLEAQDRVMSRVTSEPVSLHFQDLHRRHGVRFVFGASATEVRQADGALEVVDKDGTAYPADIVVVGIGVVPNQEFGVEAGLDASDGLLVDNDARTSDPYIYAIGDVTRFTCPREGVSLRLECVHNALDQADAAVRHILGQPTAKPEIPWFWTVQYGVRLQTAGVRSPEDDIVVRGDPASGRFSVLYLREGRLAAIDTINALRDFGAGKKLIAARIPVDSDIVADPTIPLADTTLSAKV